MVKDFKDMKEFIVLAELCNYQEAAERLYISASTLSKHIMALEDALGVQLFDRTTRSVRLTQYGEVFRDYAQRMVALYDECTAELTSLHIDQGHRLSVGFLSRLEQCGIVELLSDFSTTHPDLTLDMAASQQPQELLREQKCDFVFDTEECTKDQNLSALLYRQDGMVVVLPPGHPLAQEKQLHIEQLRSQRFIAHNDSSEENWPRLCEEAGFSPNIVMTASYTSTIVKLVRTGQGISIMDRMSIPAAILPSVSTVRLVPDIPTFIYLLYRKKHETTPAFAEFLRYIRHRSAELSAPVDEKK